MKILSCSTDAKHFLKYLIFVENWKKFWDIIYNKCTFATVEVNYSNIFCLQFTQMFRNRSSTKAGNSSLDLYIDTFLLIASASSSKPALSLGLMLSILGATPEIK